MARKSKTPSAAEVIADLERGMDADDKLLRAKPPVDPMVTPPTLSALTAEQVEGLIDVTPPGSAPVADYQPGDEVFTEQNFATREAFEATAEEQVLDPFLQRALDRAQVPSVGRIVHFVLPGDTAPRAAIVTGVRNYACLDLSIFPVGQTMQYALEVYEGANPFTGPDIVAPTRCWFWPPKV